MSENGYYPPSFPPKNRRNHNDATGKNSSGNNDERINSISPKNHKNTFPHSNSIHNTNKNKKTVIVGNNKTNHTRHDSNYDYNSFSRKLNSDNYKSFSPQQNKNSRSIPPTYTPLTKRSNRPTIYDSSRSNENNTSKRHYVEEYLHSNNAKKYEQEYGKNFNHEFNDYENADGSFNNNLAKRKTSKKRRIKRNISIILTLIIFIVIAWPSYLFYRANSRITHVDALSNMQSNDTGTTWLIAGSDSRATSDIKDGAEGERSDTIIMVHKAPNGQASIVSIPRDTLARIPGYDLDKINASFSYGGPKLLVQTVEGLTNTKIDHFIQVGMNTVEKLVDAVGGVNLCLDYDVNDELSALVWKAGCADADGKTALAFSRMRYSDPMGDIGRAQRQRQVISKLTNKIVSFSTIINPIKHLELVDAGTTSLKTDNDTGSLSILRLALAFRQARNNNLTGIPPVKSLNYMLLSGASTVLLDKEAKDAFFEKMRAGTLTVQDFNKFG